MKQGQEVTCTRPQQTSIASRDNTERAHACLMSVIQQARVSRLQGECSKQSLQASALRALIAKRAVGLDPIQVILQRSPDCKRHVFRDGQFPALICSLLLTFSRSAEGVQTRAL